MASPGRRLAKRIVIAIVGGTVTLAGIAMIVLPGPAIVVIPLGLSILATEFVWARRSLRKCRTVLRRWKDQVKARGTARAEGDNPTARGAPPG
jgi:tellurite resistance protein TerC